MSTFHPHLLTTFHTLTHLCQAAQGIPAPRWCQGLLPSMASRALAGGSRAEEGWPGCWPAPGMPGNHYDGSTSIPLHNLIFSRFTIPCYHCRVSQGFFLYLSLLRGDRGRDYFTFCCPNRACIQPAYLLQLFDKQQLVDLKVMPEY